MSNFPLRSQTLIVTALHFWFDLFLVTLVALQWLSLLWDTLIMLLSQFPLTYLQTQLMMLLSIAQHLIMQVLLGMVFAIVAFAIAAKFGECV